MTLVDPDVLVTHLRGSAVARTGVVGRWGVSRASTSPGDFVGFPPAATASSAGLARDDTRTCVTAHRDVLDAAVREPMAALLAAMAQQPWHAG